MQTAPLTLDEVLVWRECRRGRITSKTEGRTSLKCDSQPTARKCDEPSPALKCDTTLTALKCDEVSAALKCDAPAMAAAALKCDQPVPAHNSRPRMAWSPLHPPITLWLELETKCNLRCRFCYNFWKDGSAPEPERSSTTAIIASLGKLFDEAPCSQVALSGGEPLLRKDLEDIVSFISARGIASVVTTNGSLLTPERVRSLSAAGVGLFQIPLLSDNRALHDYLSGGQSWDDAVRAIMACADNGVPVVPVFVATRPNLASLHPVVRLGHLLACNRLIVNKFIPGGLGALNRAELEIGSDEELGRELTAINDDLGQLDMTIELGVPIALPPATRSALSRVRFASCPVRQGQSHYTLDSAGHLKECNHSAEVLGNAMTESFDDLRRRSTQLRQRVQSKHGIALCQFSCG